MQMNSGDEATASQGLDGERQDVRKEMLRRYSMRNADGTLVYPSGWPSVAEVSTQSDPWGPGFFERARVYGKG